MPFSLDSVESYILDARTILLDKTAPYRYTDDSLLVAFNTALLEARRLRPDMFVYKFGDRMPTYAAVSSEQVPIEFQLRLPIVYGTVAHAMLRDEEDVPVERANAFLAKFQNMLTGILASPATPTRPSPAPSTT
jgi:hypothetical protein